MSYFCGLGIGKVFLLCVALAGLTQWDSTVSCLSGGCKTMPVPCMESWQGSAGPRQLGYFLSFQSHCFAMCSVQDSSPFMVALASQIPRWMLPFLFKTRPGTGIATVQLDSLGQRTQQCQPIFKGRDTESPLEERNVRDLAICVTVFNSPQ